MRCTRLKNWGLVAVVASCILGTGTGDVEAGVFGRRRVEVREVIVTPPVVVASPPVVVEPSRVGARRDGFLFRGRRRVMARVPAVILPAPAIMDGLAAPALPSEEPEAVEAPAGELPILEENLEPLPPEEPPLDGPALDTRVVPTARPTSGRSIPFARAF